jgi:hypothetical protein
MIKDNVGGEGGGISLFNFSDASITRNIIVGGRASQAGDIYWLVPSGGADNSSSTTRSPEIRPRHLQRPADLLDLRPRANRGGTQRRSLVRGRATGPCELNVATITMAAMAALGVRSGSVPFARPTRSLCKKEVSANSSEHARTPASLCHAEGRGFESHHPLSKPLQTASSVAQAANGGRRVARFALVVTGEDVPGRLDFVSRGMFPRCRAIGLCRRSCAPHTKSSKIGSASPSKAVAPRDVNSCAFIVRCARESSHRTSQVQIVLPLLKGPQGADLSLWVARRMSDNQKKPVSP